MSIKVLTPQLVSRIAAGEVVSRPASVVKELVENSLDAQASEISIGITNSGTGLISIADNGCGIPQEEIAVAFERHATSKISSFQDLSAIQSLGFRGEALPSIASVAEVELISRTANTDAGHFIAINNGELITQGSRGRDKGTTVNVRNLFRHVPARLKFLKSASTENSHISRTVSHYALAYPEVKFTLLLNGRTSLQTSGDGNMVNCIAAIYGSDNAREMLPVTSIAGNAASGISIRVSGMVAAPNISRKNWDYISLFVNRRWITSRLLAKAVDEAYHGLLATGNHPFAIINIEITPSAIDVNIHPAKTEVKFHDNQQIFTTVQRAVRSALVDTAPVNAINQVASPGSSYNNALSPRPAHRLTPNTVQPLAEPSDWNINERNAPARQTPLTSLPLLRVLGQLKQSYIIAEGPDGLYLIDQHAAHERILFEQINRQRVAQLLAVQGLLPPVPIELSPERYEASHSQIEDLKAFGFQLEPFGINSYLVRGVPQLLYDKEWQQALLEMLDTATSPQKDTDHMEKIIATMACHSAVRAGQQLNESEMRKILSQLEKTSLPNTCPHGRPTIIFLGYHHLEREFHRT